MSTHARIGYFNSETNKIHSVYVHNDGDEAGNILKKYYNKPPIIIELLSFGNMSSLGKDIHPNNSDDNVCIFYERDRGEKNQKASITSKWRNTEEYNYLFKDGEWYVRTDGEKVWKTFNLVEKDTYETTIPNVVHTVVENIGNSILRPSKSQLNSAHKLLLDIL
jgi:hypothetical protein